MTSKITIGPGHDKTITRVNAELAYNSCMELYVGDAYDMSLREISLIERNVSEISSEITRLRDFASKPQARSSDALRKEAEKIAVAAELIISKRRWYSVSTKGLVEAAKAVGSIATPIVESAEKVISLLKQAHG